MKQILILVLCASRYRPDARKKLVAAFERFAEIKVKFVESKKELNKSLVRLNRQPDDLNTGILLPSNGMSEGDHYRYHGFVCAPIYFSATEKNKLCDDSDCWMLPVALLKRGLQLNSPHPNQE